MIPPFDEELNRLIEHYQYGENWRVAVIADLERKIAALKEEERTR